MSLSEDAAACIEQTFPCFGRNKKQELCRLVFELARNRNCRPSKVLAGIELDPLDFHQIKDQLLRRRFPSLTPAERRDQSTFPALDIREEWAVPGPTESLPEIREIFIEEAVRANDWTQDFISKCPGAKVTPIPGYQEYIAEINFTPLDYNHRRETVFLIKEKQGFLVDCPCSKGAVSCGYKILNLGQGCGFDCAYCFLQGYVNAPGLVFPANLDDFFDDYRSRGQDWRLGTGQFMDSLLYDHLTGHSRILVDFFRNFPRSVFELKTKSDNIGLLLQTAPAPNIVIAWSLNPQRIIDASEWGTASLDRRLAAARKCREAGYRVAFHFDPIVYDEGWEQDYHAVVEQMLDAVGPEGIAWVSLGTLRMTVRLKQVMEARFPFSTLLDGEQILGFDQKLRYSRRVRQTVYQSMIRALTKELPRERIYLCMEDKEMFAACGLDVPRF